MQSPLSLSAAVNVSHQNEECCVTRECGCSIEVHELTEVFSQAKCGFGAMCAQYVSKTKIQTNADGRFRNKANISTCKADRSVLPQFTTSKETHFVYYIQYILKSISSQIQGFSCSSFFGCGGRGSAGGGGGGCGQGTWETLNGSQTFACMTTNLFCGFTSGRP